MTSLVVFDGIMYDCTSKVKKDIAVKLGRLAMYRNLNIPGYPDLEYAVHLEVQIYLDRALEEGTAMYAGIAKEVA